MYFYICCILIQTSWEFVPICPISNKPALIQIMTWRWKVNKVSFEPRIYWCIYMLLGLDWYNKLLHVDTCARLHSYIKYLSAALLYKMWIYIGIMHIYFYDWISPDNAVITSENPLPEPIYVTYTWTTTISGDARYEHIHNLMHNLDIFVHLGFTLDSSHQLKMPLWTPSILWDIDVAYCFRLSFVAILNSWCKTDIVRVWG